MTVQDLRDTLRDRAQAPSPANPARHRQVLERVRRTRLRRRMTAGVALAAAVTIGAAVVPGLTRPEQTSTVATRPAPALPEQFTARDGTVYRRLAVATVERGGAESAKVAVPVSGEGLAVAAVCEGGRRVNTGLRASVEGMRGISPSFGSCDAELRLVPLGVPDGADRVGVTLDTATRGGGCVTDGQGACRPVERVEGTWTAGVYAWTPPDTPVEPEPVKDLPDSLGGRPLLDTRTGVWPRDDTVRFSFDATGRSFGLDQICTGDLARQLRFRFRVNGEEGHGGDCGVWTSGAFPMAMSEHKVRPGERVTITATITVEGGHPNRPVRWSVGLYGK